MTFAERLQPASFRGVDFLVEAGEDAFGRRNQLHEYPQRDIPFAEDLGRKAGEYNFTAFVLGDDAIEQADRLIKAISDKNTPGVLIHPIIGAIKVIPNECRRAYSSEQRIIRFTLSFSQAGESRYPDNLSSTGASVTEKADAVKAAVAKHFSDTAIVSDKPDFVRNQMTDDTDVFLTKVNETRGGEATLRTALIEQTASLGQNSTTLLDDFPSFTSQVQAVIGQVSAVYGYGQNAFNQLRGLLNFTDGFADAGDTLLMQNRATLVQLVRQTILAEMATTSLNTTFESYDDAAAQRDEFYDLADTEIRTIGATDADELFFESKALQSAVVKHITAQAASLVRLRTFQLADVLPAVVVAYDLFDTAERDVEIVARNKVRHPGYIPAGRDLQALSA